MDRDHGRAPNRAQPHDDPHRDSPLRLRVGVVVIGRNEGERLTRALRSIPAGVPSVYVDSASSDDSVSRAEALGVEAIGISPPLSAARARNVGAEFLRNANVDWIQFLDGDSTLDPKWLEHAGARLDREAEIMVLAGAQSERSHECVFTRLFDIELDRAPGEVDSVGGNALYQARAFHAVGGFDATLVAGEEAELCARLRARGGRVVRDAAPMAEHDAGNLRPRDWWRRAVRTGHAYCDGAARTADAVPRGLRRFVLSRLVWSVLLPALAIGAIPLTEGLSATLLALYPIQAVRIGRSFRAGRPLNDRVLYGLATVAGTLPELWGATRWRVAHLRRSSSTAHFEKPAAP